jgi:hypothetical protein
MYTNQQKQMPDSPAAQPSARRSREQNHFSHFRRVTHFPALKNPSKTTEKSLQSLFLNRDFQRNIFSAQNFPQSARTVADQRSSGENQLRTYANEVRIGENDLRKRENKLRIGETGDLFSLAYWRAPSIRRNHACARAPSERKFLAPMMPIRIANNRRH